MWIRWAVAAAVLAILGGLAVAGWYVRRRDARLLEREQQSAVAARLRLEATRQALRDFREVSE